MKLHEQKEIYDTLYTALETLDSDFYGKEELREIISELNEEILCEEIIFGEKEINKEYNENYEKI